ncbi:kinase-like domain-containing protein [Mycena epipterygia]|nr:kinase-like domain-containing protein [Mycena epipterygia]
MPPRIPAVPAAPVYTYLATSRAATPPPEMLLYKNLISFLKEALSARDMGPFPTLDADLRLMSSDDMVAGIIRSLENRKILWELASKLGLAEDQHLQNALRADEEQIAMLLVYIFYSKSAESAVLSLEGNFALAFLDIVQDALDRGLFIAQEHGRKARRIIHELSKSSDLLPSILFIIGVSGREEHPMPVALKHMRTFLESTDLRRIRWKLGQEALVWKDLHHPHILSFIGIDRESFPTSLCMVSPWMEHGTVLKYIASHGPKDVDKLLHEIAQGLQHLHSRNIVHGDLRGANILINQDHSACLADFGLSALADDATPSMSSSTRAGSFYWMAPELLDPDRFGLKFVRTPATDVYAFGCVCVELYIGLPPFSELREPAALQKIINGERAERPSGTPVISDALWEQVTWCWAQSAKSRPGTGTIVRNMEYLSQTQAQSLLPFPDDGPSEDIQQLFKACQIGTENATIFIGALENTTPEDIGKGIIKEFREACISFQQRLSMRIAWVSAGHHLMKDPKRHKEGGWHTNDKTREHTSGNHNRGDVGPDRSTEDELLSTLISANDFLLEALKKYDELKRLADELEGRWHPQNIRDDSRSTLAPLPAAVLALVPPRQTFHPCPFGF